MRQIDEQRITAMAPNANAVNNARKISRGNGFIKWERSADDTYYAGQCKGSGSSVYTVSADFIDGSAPLCRCSCPSRQFPCKHGLALLMEMTQDRQWELCEIPEDILSKRAKKEAREAQKEEHGDESFGDGAVRGRETKKVNRTARIKKLNKQLEGLDLAEQMVKELLEAGLGTLKGTSVKVYQDLAKQLGDHYLPGPQRMIQSLALQVQMLEGTGTGGRAASGPVTAGGSATGGSYGAQAAAGGSGDYREAVRILVYLRALIKKSRNYLEEKRKEDRLEDDNSVLYEEMGGIWTLNRLNGLGLKKEDARLVQLSFDVYADMSRREIVDKGWWIDVDSGELSVTFNYRPLKALKYVKAEDTTFQMVKTPVLTYYPGTGNRRIRWESQEFETVTDEIRSTIREYGAASLKTAVKSAKNELKNTMSDGLYGCLIWFDHLGRSKAGAGEGYILVDREGQTIELLNPDGNRHLDRRPGILPDREFCTGQVMFGVLWYDGKRQNICMQPHSIITEKEILRLLY